MKLLLEADLWQIKHVVLNLILQICFRKHYPTGKGYNLYQNILTWIQYLDRWIQYPKLESTVFAFLNFIFKRSTNLSMSELRTKSEYDQMSKLSQNIFFIITSGNLLWAIRKASSWMLSEKNKYIHYNFLNELFLSICSTIPYRYSSMDRSNLLVTWIDSQERLWFCFNMKLSITSWPQNSAKIFHFF